MGDRVEREMNEQPEGMGVGLDSFGDVPAETVAVYCIIEDAVGDEGVLGDPSGLDEDVNEEEKGYW